MSPALQRAVELARDEGRWVVAVRVFRNERTLQPDYDAPHMWLADFLEHEGRTQSAITLARTAAMQCRRKCDLLAQAAEFALFSGQVRGSIYLFAQSIATVGGGPHRVELSQQRAFLFMAELFDVFDDASGERWARGIQDVTYFDEDYVRTIRSTAEKTTAKERARIRRELPEIRKQLRERVNGKS